MLLSNKYPSKKYIDNIKIINFINKFKYKNDNKTITTFLSLSLIYSFIYNNKNKNMFSLINIT